MLNVLKKAEKPHVGGKVKGLAPPKNLPDLAKDIYDKDDPREAKHEEMQQGTPADQKAETDKSGQKPVTEPEKGSVPRLDLNLVRQHLASSFSAIQSIPENHPIPQRSQAGSGLAIGSASIPLGHPDHGRQNDVTNDVTNIYPEHPHEKAGMLKDAKDASDHRGASSNAGSGIKLDFLSSVDDGTGFFKEFEEYVKDNGLENDIVDDLLNKNWLDHMYFYHTTKGEDMPFYASSAELSHAIRLKLEELQNLERNWIGNKQKVDILRKLSSALESEVHLKSEELKRLILESRKRGNINRKSDFFHIMKPKDGPKNDKSKDDTLPSEMGKQKTADIQKEDTENVIMEGHEDRHDEYGNNILHVKPTDQPPIEQRYNLKRYVANDPSKYFYSSDGQVFKSLMELISGLENMDQGTFDHHVNLEKNDFANWIKGVFEDFRLSDSIRSIDEKENLWYFLKNNTI